VSLNSTQECAVSLAWQGPAAIGLLLRHTRIHPLLAQTGSPVLGLLGQGLI
jgi:hypothetical protein